MLDRGFGREARVRAAQVVAHAGHALREPLDVQLVDHRLGPGAPQRRVPLPVERVVGHDRARDRRRRVLSVQHVLVARRVGEHPRPAEPDRAFDRLRIGIDQELRRVEAMAGGRLPRPADPVAVALSRADAGEVDVPVVRGPLGDVDALLAALVVEQAELDAVRVLAEEGEVRPVAVPGRAEGKRPSGPHCATHRGTLAPRSEGAFAPSASRRRPPQTGNGVRHRFQSRSDRTNSAPIAPQARIGASMRLRVTLSGTGLRERSSTSRPTHGRSRPEPC